jgi:AraC-like DNA-binding protein
MRSDLFFKNDFLPFAELRFSRSSIAFFKPHMHQTIGIGAVHEGEVLYDVNGKKAILAPGSLVVINPETLHTCNPANERERSYYMLHLDTNWCFQVQRSMWKIEQFVKVEKSRLDDVPLYEQYAKTVEHLMDEKVHLQEKEQMLFDLVCDVFSVACSTQLIKKEHTDNIEDLKKILSVDLQKDYTLDSLAEELGVNPYTLIRSFKAVTGITPHAYRMNCRIEHARKLLRQGGNIAETALECGFFDQSHFHRHFKAMTTVTPQEYRVNFVQ